MRFRLVNKTHYRTDDIRALVGAGIRAEGEPEKRYSVIVVYARQDRGVSGLASLGGSWIKLRVPKGKHERVARAQDIDLDTRGSVARGDLARYIGALRRHSLYVGGTWSRWDLYDKITAWKNNRRFAVNTRTVTHTFDVLPDALRDDFARTLVHEMLHNRGVDHREMHRCHKRCGEKHGVVADVPWAQGLQIRAQEKKAAPTVSERVEKREAHARAMLERAERRLKVAKTVRARWAKKVTYYERRKAAGRAS